MESVTRPEATLCYRVFCFVSLYLFIFVSFELYFDRVHFIRAGIYLSDIFSMFFFNYYFLGTSTIAINISKERTGGKKRLHEKFKINACVRELLRAVRVWIGAKELAKRNVENAREGEKTKIKSNCKWLLKWALWSKYRVRAEHRAPIQQQLTIGSVKVETIDRFRPGTLRSNLSDVLIFMSFVSTWCVFDTWANKYRWPVEKIFSLKFHTSSDSISRRYSVRPNAGALHVAQVAAYCCYNKVRAS